jgi:cystathionine beta-lyase family protein involved in aluminum resistance
MEFSEKLIALADEADKALANNFARISVISNKNTARVLDAFRSRRVSDAIFAPSTGYGYGDRGRETLDAVWADVFGAEAAIVRHNIVNGTHALTIGLFGLLRPGDIMLSVTGKPYDTLDRVIGIGGNTGDGSLADFGVEYRQIDMVKDGGIDYASLAALPDGQWKRIKVVYAQRSKGYMNRRTLTAGEITKLTNFIHENHPGVYVVVDNCYGEFTEEREPYADLLIGSLIKNPGGGMADSGGYLAGTARAVELASYRLTTVGTGAEVGASLGQTRNMFKGLFYAPHTTAEALKTAHFAAYVFEKLGFRVEPGWDSVRSDIIQTVICGSEKRLCAFCRGIQAGSPVDSFATPEPWDMPGYSDKVIMAAGTFVQGASIELSADGPIRPPFTAFFQGGLTYESGRIGILSAAEAVENCPL